MIKQNTTIKALSREGDKLEETRITKLLSFRGLDRVPVDEAHAGDIVAIAGFQSATVADTLCDKSVDKPIDAQPIDPPTLAMTFSINDLPLAGTEGDKVTSRVIRPVTHEAEGNVALQIRRTDDPMPLRLLDGASFNWPFSSKLCAGRALNSLSAGRVLSIKKILRPSSAWSPSRRSSSTSMKSILERWWKNSARKGELIEMRSAGADKQRLVFHTPSRSLIGYHGEFMTDTRGTGVMNRLFHGYAPYKGTIGGRRNGAMISMSDGKAVAYALWNLEERGPLFVIPGDKIYPGMIVGEHAKGQDLEVNPLKAKQLTNIRASGKDDAVDLTPPLKMDLDKSLAYIGDDELVEVTPTSIRLRKRYQTPMNERGWLGRVKSPNPGRSRRGF